MEQDLSFACCPFSTLLLGIKEAQRLEEGLTNNGLNMVVDASVEISDELIRSYIMQAIIE